MRGSFWLMSLVGATGAFRLYVGCGAADAAAADAGAADGPADVGFVDVGAADVGASSAATPCPRIELQPSSACVPWPTAPAPTVATTDGGVGCTWSDVTGPGIDQAIGPSQSGAMWATASDQVYVAITPRFTGAMASVAHLDGTRWIREELPIAATVFSLWSASGGDVWASVGWSTFPNAKDPTRCVGPVFRRASGIWGAEPPLDIGNAPGAIVTGLDDDHVVAFAASDSGSRAFRRCGKGWTEIPRRATRPGTAFSVASVTTIGAHVLAFGGGVDTASHEIFAFLDVFDGTSLDAIDIPVALTDIGAISGLSIDDLYVVGLNRNVDGTTRVFHVTEALKTWSPLPVSDSLTMSYLSPPMFGTVFGLGCDWPNKYASPPTDCTRFGPLSPKGPFKPGPIDGGVFGFPGSVAADRNHGLHVLGPADGDAGGVVTQWHHHRARCETVANP